MSKTTKRRVNPPLLVLALLCLAMPFTAVSCESSMMTVEAEYTGWDLAFGGEPTVEVEGEADKSPSEESSSLPAQPLMIIAIVVLVAGLVLLSTSRATATAGIVVGATAAIFLIFGQVVTQNVLVAKVSESEDLSTSTVSEWVETRSGFWFALILLVAMTAYNTAALVRGHRSTTTTSPQVPPAWQ